MNDNISMMVSSIVRKDGNKAIYVLFTDQKKNCELILPEKKLLTNKGFSEDELKSILDYVENEADAIMQIAKNVDPMKGFMGRKQGE